MKVRSRTTLTSPVSAAKPIRAKELYWCDTFLETLAQHLQDVAAALRQFIQREHAVVRPRRVTRPRLVVTTAVRALVRPATPWVRAMAGASTRVMAGH